MTNPPRPFPRDGRIISLILAAKGIQDADERVIHQLLDFAHRYTSDVLTSAQTLADHASRPGAPKIEKEDIELAIQLRKRNEFFEPPPRDYLATLSNEINSIPLPLLPETFDILRLPPPHQRLTEVNFDLVPEAGLTFDSDDEGGVQGGDKESSDEEGEGDGVGDGDDGSTLAGDGDVDGDGEDEDMDMEEVGVGTGGVNGGMGEMQMQVERTIDEDYDE